MHSCIKKYPNTKKIKFSSYYKVDFSLLYYINSTKFKKRASFFCYIRNTTLNMYHDHNMPYFDNYIYKCRDLSDDISLIKIYSIKKNISLTILLYLNTKQYLLIRFWKINLVEEILGYFSS